MSEKYGSCRACLGTGTKSNVECGICNGTGFSGDAMDYLYPAQRVNTGRTTRTSDKPIRYDICIESAVSAIVSSQLVGSK